MKELNTEQVNKLFDFVRSKYVRYIDVQHELVDHLASDIEVEMENDSSLSFEGALQKVYSKFPISGFSNTVSKSESAMSNYWKKVIFDEFTLYGRIPFLLVLAVLILINYQLIILFGTPALYALLVSVLIIGYWSIRGLRSILKGEKSNIDDKYLVISVFKSWAMVFSIFPFIMSQFLSDFRWIHNINSEMTIQIIFFSVMISLSFIWSAMAYYRFPELIKAVLKGKYAHLNLSI